MHYRASVDHHGSSAYQKLRPLLRAYMPTPLYQVFGLLRERIVSGEIAIECSMSLLQDFRVTQMG